MQKVDNTLYGAESGVFGSGLVTLNDGFADAAVLSDAVGDRESRDLSRRARVTRTPGLRYHTSLSVVNGRSGHITQYTTLLLVPLTAGVGISPSIPHFS